MSTLCWAEATAVRVDDGLSDVADLDVAVLGEAYQQDQARSGVMAKRWASNPVATPICCRRARASLS
jgi:hypothetical protein